MGANVRWLAVTLALVAATGALLGGMYLRDRRPGAWHPPSAFAARADAESLLSALNGGRCGGCAVTRLRPASSGLWFARLRIEDQVRCVRIDPDRFAMTPESGLVGMEVVACR